MKQTCTDLEAEGSTARRQLAAYQEEAKAANSRVVKLEATLKDVSLAATVCGGCGEPITRGFSQNERQLVNVEEKYASLAKQAEVNRLEPPSSHPALYIDAFLSHCAKT